MADTAHALVFLDTHDNQRLISGRNIVLVYQYGPREYKIGSAFMLAYDYGFKREMSSYSWQNQDEGPPTLPPNQFPEECGNGWTCEHRLDVSY